MMASRYGRFFIESLPRMPLVHDLQAIRRFFHPSPNSDPLLPPEERSL
jgi:hypothetical protein